jgi:hypothetical protein
MKWSGMTGYLFRTRLWVSVEAGTRAMSSSGLGSAKGSNLGLGGSLPFSLGGDDGTVLSVGFLERAGQ